MIKVDAKQGVVVCDATAKIIVFLAISLSIQMGSENNVDKDDDKEPINLPVFFDIFVLFESILYKYLILQKPYIMVEVNTNKDI